MSSTNFEQKIRKLPSRLPLNEVLGPLCKQPRSTPPSGALAPRGSPLIPLGEEVECFASPYHEALAKAIDFALKQDVWFPQEIFRELKTLGLPFEKILQIAKLAYRMFQLRKMGFPTDKIVEFCQQCEGKERVQQDLSRPPPRWLPDVQPAVWKLGGHYFKPVVSKTINVVEQVSPIETPEWDILDEKQKLCHWKYYLVASGQNVLCKITGSASGTGGGSA